MREIPIIKHYSAAFKRKVISEIESGKYNKSEAMKIYDITGGATINSWLKKYGKNHLISKIVRIEMADETNKIKELEQRIKFLEKALADSEIKNIISESVIEVATEHFGVDIKKNFGSKVQSGAYKTGKEKGKK